LEEGLTWLSWGLGFEMDVVGDLVVGMVRLGLGLVKLGDGGVLWGAC
jgi:hypothetical protein